MPSRLRYDRGMNQPPIKRRPFLRQLSTAAAFAATACLHSRTSSADDVTKQALAPREPFVRTGPPRLKTSLAAYSFRGFFATMKGKPQAVPDGSDPITMVDFLDYCVAQGFDGGELTSYFFPPDSDDAYYRSLKRAAFLRGLAVSGTAIGNHFTGPPEKLGPEIAKAIDSIAMASSLGAPHIRFFAGSGDQLRANPERIDSVCDAVLKCADVAEKAGVFLGIENHGNLTVDQMMELMSRLDHPWVGVNLDTGNFYSNTPYDDIARCLPYTVNIQVKVMMQDANRKKYPADFGPHWKTDPRFGIPGICCVGIRRRRSVHGCPESNRGDCERRWEL